MNEEYILNTIKGILSKRKVGKPNFVPHQELIKAVLGDLKVVLNELVANNSLLFRRDINGRPLFYINERVDKDI